MIPKTIHYCWFGGTPLSAEAKKCIDSWKYFFPDYEIKCWDETNFDINCCDYVRKAYADKKWAYVSDYARFYILYHQGGVYFDTDVEVIKPFDDILIKGSFMGEEQGGINPGLGLAVAPGLGLAGEMLKIYEKIHYKNDKIGDEKTIVDYTTELLRKKGFVGNGEIENVDGITIYPPEYFCPMDYATGELLITEHTHSIHYYTASWLTSRSRQWVGMERWITRKLGKNMAGKLFGNHLWASVRMIYGKGFREFIWHVRKKISKNMK